jgi:hypothetical protein
VKRFTKILVVSREGSGDRATPARAAELAKWNRARLTWVEVVEELPRELQRVNASVLAVKPDGFVAPVTV